MVFEKAWRFLKASRQTELGEFHPDFPSSYGPMTAITSQPTQRFLDDWQYKWNQDTNDYDKSMAQPYEAFVHEGIKALPATPRAVEWESGVINGATMQEVKPFNLEGKRGRWFAPASNYQRVVDENKFLGRDMTNMDFNSPRSRVAGIRLPLDASMGQFRDKGYGGEGAEAFIERDIPPERVVMVPKMWTHQKRGEPWPGGLGRVDG